MLIKTFLEIKKNTEIELFEEFLNDYPVQFLNLEDYIIDINKHLNYENCKALTFENLKLGIKKLNSLENAWLIESITSLIEYIDTLNIEKKDELPLSIIFSNTSN